MLDDALRRRLEALNRQALPPPVSQPAAAIPTSPRRRAARSERRRSSSSRTAAHVVRPRGELLGNAIVVETPAGNHLQIRIPLEELWAGGDQLVIARHRFLKQCHDQSDRTDSTESEPSPRSRTTRPEQDRAALIQAFPAQIAFLDLETCGLAGSSIFLIGLLRSLAGRLTVELLLARNYAEEKAILTTLWQTMARVDVLVTYNGKSFDWPMVHDRSTRFLIGRRRSAAAAEVLPVAAFDDPLSAQPLSRQDLRPDPYHVDLLHHARRRFKNVLPNCKLLTLEERICLRSREGDIDGALIPAAYQQFVVTKELEQMESILFHNAIDLVTLLDLAMRLCDCGGSSAD